MSETDHNPNSIIRMLLENLTNSLTKLVVKYESVARDCERLEQHLSSMSGTESKVTEIKDGLGQIRTQCVNNTDILRGLSSDISESRKDFSALVNNAEKTLAVHGEKMDSMEKQLLDVKTSLNAGLKNVLIGQTSLNICNSEIKEALIPISRFSKLVSKPVTISLFVLALLITIWGTTEILLKIKSFSLKDKNPPAQTSGSNTERSLLKK